MVHGTLESPSVVFETWGKLNTDKTNAVMIFSGLSPSSHVASSPADPKTGWWEDIVGPNKPIDTNKYFVICANSLGSCFGTTGPASIDPKTNKAYRLTFPKLCIEDIAQAGKKVLDHLDISILHTVMGPSMGGMTALAFTLANPGRAKRLVSISAAARSSPFAIAIRSLQREMIRTDESWNNGNYEFSEPPAKGMRMARKLGMISYRSAEEWLIRFGRERAMDIASNNKSAALDFEIESYLEAHAHKFVGTFDANCYLYLSRAMDLFDATDYCHDGTGKLNLDGVISATIIGVETDFLFPLQQQTDLAELISETNTSVNFKSLPSLQGHDSFLVDMDRFRPTIASCF
tara:strand:+ start:387 stop:1427 length:1041 start_codon:yes stop_codon:yes gene_type:complete